MEINFKILFQIFKKKYPQWDHLNFVDRCHESVINDWINFLENFLLNKEN